MTNINSVSDVQSQVNTTTEKKSTNVLGGLDSSSYLTLFLETLKNQDPTNAMSSSEMMQQMSLLSQMQAIYDLQDTVTAMSENLTGSKIQQNSALLGKEITAVKADGTLVQGKAEDMYISGDLITLLVNGNSVNLGEVSRVSVKENKGGDI